METHKTVWAAIEHFTYQVTDILIMLNWNRKRLQWNCNSQVYLNVQAVEHAMHYEAIYLAIFHHYFTAASLQHQWHNKGEVQHLITTEPQVYNAVCKEYSSISVRIHQSVTQLMTRSTQSFCFWCLTLCFLANRMLRRNFGSTCTTISKKTVKLHNILYKQPFAKLLLTVSSA